MWKKYITRRLAVQVAQSWNFGWGQAMRKVYGVCVSNTLVFRDQEKTEYWVDKKQHHKYVNQLYCLLKNEIFLRIFHKEARASLEMILYKTKKVLSKDLSKLSNQELLNIYTKFILPSVEQFYIRMWTVFNIGEPLSQVIKQKLYEYIDVEQDVIDHLLILSSPLKPNDALNQRIGLLQLAQNKNRTKEELTKHVKKFCHLPMFDFDHEPHAVEDFLKELNSIEDAGQEIAEIYRNLTETKKCFHKLIANLEADKELQLLIEFLQENVWLRDYRDMIRQKFNLELKKFYQEVGKRLGLNIKQVAILTNDEIVEHLSKNKRFDQQEIKQREKNFLLIQKGNKVEIFSGQEALEKAKQKLLFKKLQENKGVRGVVGARGRAQGKVKIIYTNKDLDKIERGDIMVTAMTRQDFVPNIRKAKALITDEGSVTCHAAIIARELKIPCVVATHHATQVFKDGDVVEVDADRGTITKL